MLHLTTIGRVTGRAREIEIWFIFHHEKFYVFSKTSRSRRLGHHYLMHLSIAGNEVGLPDWMK